MAVKHYLLKEYLVHLVVVMALNWESHGWRMGEVAVDVQRNAVQCVVLVEDFEFHWQQPFDFVVAIVDCTFGGPLVNLVPTGEAVLELKGHYQHLVAFDFLQDPVVGHELGPGWTYWMQE